MPEFESRLLIFFFNFFFLKNTSGKKAEVKTEQNWKVVDIVITVGKSLG